MVLVVAELVKVVAVSKQIRVAYKEQAKLRRITPRVPNCLSYINCQLQLNFNPVVVGLAKLAAAVDSAKVLAAKVLVDSVKMQVVVDLVRVAAVVDSARAEVDLARAEVDSGEAEVVLVRAGAAVDLARAGVPVVKRLGWIIHFIKWQCRELCLALAVRHFKVVVAAIWEEEDLASKVAVSLVAVSLVAVALVRAEVSLAEVSLAEVSLAEVSLAAVVRVAVVRVAVAKLLIPILLKITLIFRNNLIFKIRSMLQRKNKINIDDCDSLLVFNTHQN